MLYAYTMLFDLFELNFFFWIRICFSVSEPRRQQKWRSRRITLRTTNRTRPTRTASRSPSAIATPPPKGYLLLVSCLSLLFMLCVLIGSFLFLLSWILLDGSQVFEEPEVCKEAQQEERWGRQRGRVDLNFSIYPTPSSENGARINFLCVFRS